MRPKVGSTNRHRTARRHAALILLGLFAPLAAADAPAVTGPPSDDLQPAPRPDLDAARSAIVHRGQEVFSTQWVPAGTVGASARSGVGPLFNAPSCTSCHNRGGHGDGPTGDGPAPVALVIKLAAPSAAGGSEPAGDPVYGRVFNVAAIEGAQREGVAMVQYREISGNYYPGGGYWHLRDPQYRLRELHYGPLAATTVVQPRVAPALYGVGLLEAVSEAAIVGDSPEDRRDLGIRGEPARQYRHGGQEIGRFGWQGNSVSVRHQVAKAFAREMGLTTADESNDDCTVAQPVCLRLPNGGSPEVTDDSFSAVIAYVTSIPVPESPSYAGGGGAGATLFKRLGCSGCHRPQLPIERSGADGTRIVRSIAPYTDLRLHDLGRRMADRDVAGKVVTSRWRTAPLWGLGYRLATEPHPTFLHDGRARTIEEAILWHFGEGAISQSGFRSLLPRQRAALLQWLQTL